MDSLPEIVLDGITYHPTIYSDYRIAFIFLKKPRSYRASKIQIRIFDKTAQPPGLAQEGKGRKAIYHVIGEGYRHYRGMHKHRNNPKLIKTDGPRSAYGQARDKSIRHFISLQQHILLHTPLEKLPLMINSENKILKGFALQRLKGEVNVNEFLKNFKISTEMEHFLLISTQ